MIGSLNDSHDQIIKRFPHDQIIKRSDRSDRYTLYSPTVDKLKKVYD